MTDYYALRVVYSPHTQDADDLMAAFLADVGYESFESLPEGLLAYVPAKDFSEEAYKTVLADFPMDVEITNVSAERIIGEDWNKEWEKNYFKPIVVGNECVVHSSFHKDVPQARYDIVIDPKMAFGTGHHATTSMMLRRLLSSDLSGKSVIDMGTGTGILAILAEKLGASKVVGIEIDPDAAENAREHVVMNDCRNIEIITGDSDSLLNLEKVDIFLANINRNVILADFERYASAMKPGAKIFLSGFYEKDVPILERAASLYGLKSEGYTCEGEGWTQLCMTKSDVI